MIELLLLAGFGALTAGAHKKVKANEKREQEKCLALVRQNELEARRMADEQKERDKQREYDLKLAEARRQTNLTIDIDIEALTIIGEQYIRAGGDPEEAYRRTSKALQNRLLADITDVVNRRRWR